MTRIPRLAWLAYFVSVSVLWSAACARSTLPSALTDREFWELITTLSEQPGRFPLSDNFVSNEPRVSENARWLSPSGGVYIGVGPEQNFSYIARLQPTMAFIVDIRRENRDLQLLYKALFELSADRVDFVARLFSRPRPAGLGPSASVEEVFRRYEGVTPSRQDYEKNAALIRQQLVRVHGFPLSDPELEAIDRALNAFYAEGPEIQFWGARSVDARRPSYRQLMTAKDLMGESRSFLATEGAFTLVKELQSRNRIVPVVGDFGGAHAIRRVGGYVRDHADAITGFYASNVAVYLTNEQARAFCCNLASLPAARGAFSIESDAVRPLTAKLTACAGSPRQLGARCDLRDLRREIRGSLRAAGHRHPRKTVPSLWRRLCHRLF